MSFYGNIQHHTMRNYDGSIYSITFSKDKAFTFKIEDLFFSPFLSKVFKELMWWLLKTQPRNGYLITHTRISFVPHSNFWNQKEKEGGLYSRSTIWRTVLGETQLKSFSSYTQPPEVSYLVYTFRKPQQGNSGSIINTAFKTGLEV